MSLDERYSTVEEMLSVAKRDRKVIRMNSLAGIFMWTPDTFEQQRAENTFPARCDVCNFRLQPLTEAISGIAREIEEQQGKTMSLLSNLVLLRGFAGVSMADW